MSIPKLPEGWSASAIATGGFELHWSGRHVGWLEDKEGQWRIAIVDEKAWRALAGDPDVELQGLVRTIVVGAITAGVMFCAPKAVKMENGTITLVANEASAAEEGYSIVRDVNPTIRTHRAGPILADRATAMGKTAILVVRTNDGERHGDLPVRIDRIEERDGRRVYSGVVVEPPADMQSQLRKDWYPAAGTRVEFAATDVRDLLELRIDDAQG